MNNDNEEVQSPIDLSGEIPLLPLRNAAVFPGAVLSFELGRPKTLAMAESIKDLPTPVLAAFCQKDPDVEHPDKEDLYPIGTLVRVAGIVKQPSGTFAVVVEGVERVELSELLLDGDFPRAKVSRVTEIVEKGDELDALFLTLRDTTKDILKHLPGIPREVRKHLETMEDPVRLADFVAQHMEVPIADKARFLATLDVKKRLRDVLEQSVRRLEVLKTRDRINSQVKDEIGKNQREHILRQQLKAIQDELGEGEDGDNDLEGLEKRLAAADLPEEAASVAKKQLKRLRGMQAGSPEGSMVRTYLEWILDLPWKKAADEAVELTHVREVLDADHYGLEKVKKRILEFLAVQKLRTSASEAEFKEGDKDGEKGGPAEKPTRSRRTGAILCLVGPPGVGKTSLGKSVARAMGRKFQRISLGGVHDEAAIRGHRRTYIGALPGQILQSMKKAGTTNPVFMLDEVDKLGSDYRGDPSSALLEVLDPEQNDTFTDHYLDIAYDLSQVMFIATANNLDTISPPLRDRMEIIEIPGYTRREKQSIAKTHLLPKQLREHGVTAEQVEITDNALAILVERYTREAGVRSLEKKIAGVVRGAVVKLAEGDSSAQKFDTEDDLRKHLGAPPFSSELVERTEDPGVATGLAWTPVGGEILFIEATRMPGSGKLTLTGQLGDVMKESAQAALSYVRANADKWGIPRDFLDKSDLHVHVPAGAMPKDGPSAGVTMLTALVSLLTGVRVRHDVAMTGEITLRGRVLPIGGLKEKTLAAHRAGIKRVIVPERNRHDLDEVPKDVLAELEFVFVSRMSQVIDAALETVPTPTPKLVPQPTPGGAPAGIGSFGALA
jgi:ATP-dependent Lon protease